MRGSYGPTSVAMERGSVKRLQEDERATMRGSWDGTPRAPAETQDEAIPRLQSQPGE
jgi:hypothetical protein